MSMKWTGIFVCKWGERRGKTEPPKVMGEKALLSQTKKKKDLYEWGGGKTFRQEKITSSLRKKGITPLSFEGKKHSIPH